MSMFARPPRLVATAFRLRSNSFPRSAWERILRRGVPRRLGAAPPPPTRFTMALAALSLTLFFLASPAHAQEEILVDQSGYRPGDAKIAFIRSGAKTEFEVMNAETGKRAYLGKVRSIGAVDPATGDDVFALDLTVVAAPGTYRIRIPGTELTSGDFSVGADVYRPAALSALGSFYYQRCGMEVNNGSIWRHPPCHTNDAVFFDRPSDRRDVAGGWHDAGDYGKYIATAGVSAAFLLYLYEAQPEKFTDRQLNIPEAGNGVPDILDEARWELAWMLKMQNDDGSVAHKVSTKKWTGEYLPEKDPDTRYIFPASSAATASFAAVTAIAARVFTKWDKVFARSLLKASLGAWKYLQAHETIVPSGGFRNPEGVEGGEYGDQQDLDERLWAAVELYRTTGNSEYNHYFLAMYKQLGVTLYPVSWTQVQNFAFESYLKLPAARTDFSARSLFISRLAEYGDNLLKRIESSAYRCVLTPDEYYWGSNSVVAGYAFDLIQAYESTRQQRFLKGALDQLHYLLGRNTFNISFVTGVGAHPVRHPYHQFSMMLQAPDPVPGLLVGGPNKGSSLQGRALSGYPGKCYEDNQKNYFVNEVAINYTAPFAFAAGYFAEMNTATTRESQ